MTTVVDPNTPLWTYVSAGAQLLNPNGMMPDAGSLVPAPAFDNGHLFDVSAWDSWTLLGTVTTAVATCDLTLVFYDTFSGHGGGVKQIVKLPQNAAQTGPFAVVGRVLGPLMTAQLQASPAGFVGQLDFMVNNRPRLYDAPYTPGPLGTILAGIPQTFKSAVTSISLDLPYYLGPAVITVNAGGDTTATELGVFAQLVDDVSPPHSVGYVNTNGGTQRLWVPNLPASATKWSLQVVNGSAASATIGAALVAG